MREFIEKFAKQLEEAMDIASRSNIRKAPSEIRQVVVLGLGGSAFGAELVKNYVEDYLPIPLLIVRDYTIPPFVNEKTLVIASSYSGNTEETLSALEQALVKKAHIVTISSGGKLIEIAQTHGLDAILLPQGYPPRAAVAFSFVAQIFILKSLGLIPELCFTLINDAIPFVQSFQDFDSVKMMAKQFYGRIPVLYSTPSSESIAIRFRQQIEENAKQLCWHHVIPEMNHNELVGWELPNWIMEKIMVCFIESPSDHPRNQLRTSIIKQVLHQKNASFVSLVLKGSNTLEQLLYGLHFSDWVSYELAILNQVEPTPVYIIDFLKNSLSQAQ